MTDEPMIIICGHMLLDPEDRDPYVALFTEMVGRGRAHDGNLALAITADALDPRRVNNLEVWRDAEALEAWRAVANAPESDREVSETHMNRYNATDCGDLFAQE